jgi:hypothetical protein
MRAQGRAHGALGDGQVLLEVRNVLFEAQRRHMRDDGCGDDAAHGSLPVLFIHRRP